MLASLRSDGWTASPELVDDFTGIRIQRQVWRTGAHWQWQNVLDWHP
jgi:hypothetical protein